MYKLEMHVHTSPTSRCASAKAEDAVAQYTQVGYHGLVLTNHINNSTYRYMEDMPWNEKVAHFVRGYEDMQRAAAGRLTVLFGCEINLTPLGASKYIPNDYLIYGATPQWLLEAGDVRRMSLEQLSESARKAGFLIVEAHPFRYDSVIMDDRLLDGVEVYNANKNHDSHDYLAELWAEKKHLIRTTGSDFHDPHDHTAAGIMTEEPIEDNETLLRVLRSGAYELIRPDMD